MPQKLTHITINLKASERKIIKRHLVTVLRNTTATHTGYCYDNELAGSMNLFYPKEYRTLQKLLKKIR